MMKRLVIEIMHSSEDALHAFKNAWREAERGNAKTPRLAFGSIRDLFSTITEKRLELLRHVATHQGEFNTRQLALSLNRDYKNIHTDVSALEELGLLEKDGEGRLSVPFDEIVIHAGLTRAA